MIKINKQMYILYIIKKSIINVTGEFLFLTLTRQCEKNKNIFVPSSPVGLMKCVIQLFSSPLPLSPGIGPICVVHTLCCMENKILF